MLASSGAGGDRSLVVTPPTPKAARIWIDYGDSDATWWVSVGVGQDSRFEVDTDFDKLSAICGAVFRGQFRERLRVSGGKILESEGLVGSCLATTHQAAWSPGVRAELRASAWQEVTYAPYAVRPQQ